MERLKNIPLISTGKMLESMKSIRPAMEDLQRSQEVQKDIMANFQQSKINKKNEELRHHNELINSLKVAGEKKRSLHQNLIKSQY